MINIKDFFELAQLAEASYANLTPGKILEVELKNADNSMSFSDTQAQEFLNNWSVVSLGHQPNTDSGYSSTLFQRKDDGSYVLAFRGTEPLAQFPGDLGADIGDIVSDGLAFEQIVDMHNEWLRIISPGVYSAAKVEVLGAETLMLATLAANPVAYAAYLATLSLRNDVIIDLRTDITTGAVIPVVKTITFVNSDVLFTDDRKTGLGLQAEIMDKGLTVTGHSLGGHLASAFTRLFPETYAEALTINGAGFGKVGLTGFAAANVANVFSMLQGEQGFVPTDVHNLYGDKNWEVVTQNGYWLFQPGAHESLFIEQEDLLQDVLAHGSGQITDSLAVYDLFFRLASNASLVNLQSVFESASHERAPSLESLVNMIGDMFTAGSKIITPGDREQLHARLEAIRTNESFIAMAGLLTLTTATGADARNDYSQFLSLYFLTPFAFEGSEALLGELNPSLYQQWLADKNLSATERSSGFATFSDQWLADRAHYLQAVTARNESDITTDESADPTGINARFYSIDGVNLDRAIIYSGGTNANNFNQTNAPRIVFGNDQDNNPANSGPDAFVGGNGDDRLYGMGGNDRLQGNQGNDYLEGGAGNDVLDGGEDKDLLKGGTGNDRYEFTGDFGKDVIVDSDGGGSIWIDNIQLKELFEVEGSGNLFRDAEERFQVLRSEGAEEGVYSLLITRVGYSEAGNAVRVEGWTEGDLDIALGEAQEDTTPYTPLPTEPGGNLIQPFRHVDGVGADITGGDAADMLHGSRGADRIDGGAGDDWISGLLGPDVIHGGDGHDFITGVGGEAVASGGMGNDVLMANIGLTFLPQSLFQVSGPSDTINIDDDVIWTDFRNHWGMTFDIDALVSLNAYYGYEPALSIITPGTFTGDSVLGDGLTYEISIPRTNVQPNSFWFLYHSDSLEPGITVTYFHPDSTEGKQAYLQIRSLPIVLADGVTLEQAVTAEGSTLVGDEGDDLLVGWFSRDTLLGGAGRDALYGDDALIAYGDNGIQEVLQDLTSCYYQPPRVTPALFFY